MRTILRAALPILGLFLAGAAASLEARTNETPSTIGSQDLVVTLEKLQRHQIQQDGRTLQFITFVVRVENRSKTAAAIPPLRIALRNAQGRIVQSGLERVNKMILKPGEATVHKSTWLDIPKDAYNLDVNFETNL